ncbi:biotin--[acetyl-CoA-carboxylase] ligase [Hydrogenophaga sp. OTU3427]|uniref:biotin--[acetyl-CoA-carboxylase] ligase n=1 Tax=Hydrogenophaga sp. OTU3427 TaxID=3043856 RepID=UPI00313CAE91
MNPLHASLNHHAERVWEAVAPGLPGFSVEVLAEIDSTNTELMRRARTDVLAPTLLVALAQTAGRGRRGKAWVSAPGDSLTFSLGLPLTPANWSGLSLAVGVSLADSLHPEVRLKWPNDLWWAGRKLGGILVETANPGANQGAGRCAVVGVGLNLATPALPEMPATEMPALPPAGLRECLPGLEAGALLLRVLPALVRDLQAFEALGFEAFAQRFSQRDALLDQAVRTSDGLEGTACGVGTDGCLRVLTTQGMRDVSSAEVSVRPC